MASRMTGDLLLLGTVPLHDTDDVFRTCGPLFGDAVTCLPDGETGPRQFWVNYEAHFLFHPHPSVETEQKPIPPPGFPEYFPSHLFATYYFHLKPGVKDLKFERLQRIDDALESYRLFRTYREDGTIPDNVRFQVCLPFPSSAFAWFFRSNFEQDYPIVQQAYEAAMAEGLKQLFDEIPADDLAIQWDACFELLDIERLFQWTDRDGAWERFAGPVRRLSPLVPEEALLGYHICYGTLGGWPMREADDMMLSVRMANAAIETSGRVVDYVHLAGPRSLRTDDLDFYRPLQELRPGDAKIYLGLLLPEDGEIGLTRRVAAARRYLPEFGIAGYCGFGRQPGLDPKTTLHNHRDAANAVIS